MDCSLLVRVGSIFLDVLTSILTSSVQVIALTADLRLQTDYYMSESVSRLGSTVGVWGFQVPGQVLAQLESGRATPAVTSPGVEPSSESLSSRLLCYLRIFRDTLKN